MTSQLPSGRPSKKLSRTGCRRQSSRILRRLNPFRRGSYAHLREKIPDYLAAPGNFFIAICHDGIVVRYERKTQHERKRVVAVVPQPIAKVAAMLSQNLLYIGSPAFPLPPSKTFGVELKLSVHSPSEGASRDFATRRIWFQVDGTAQHVPQAAGAKPFCLLSVRNYLDVEFHGLMRSTDVGGTTDQPFVARSTIRLQAGWDCIEVFPTLDLQPWVADSAQLWADRGILGAILVAQTKDAQLSNLDPRAATRRMYVSVLNAFKELLESDPEREQVLQAFLQRHPVLLCPTHVRMWPKLPLGATVTDFVFRDATNDYLLVELERSTLPLFRQDGHPTADLTHAHGQIVDWKRYLEDNLQTVQRELGLTGITPNPKGLLVIGRSHVLQPRDRRKLQTMTNESPKLRIMTYDDVYENAKAVLENLLGPLWDPGGATQIYYPTSQRGG